MEAALLSLVGVLVAQLLVVHFKGADTRTAQEAALASFLEKTAECLEEMREKLSAHTIPTGTGTRLKTHIREYERILDKGEIKRKEQVVMRTAIGEIKKCLLAGQAEDEILKGSALSYEEADRNKVLDDLQRSAARLRGEADALRTKVV